ncbi:MAG: succinate dehydrogenase cytochrome b subunit [Candidatus Omnitrophica bacterium]|nr:succinate dehydrogenase cytochrome b subunit [Candidatus Omnitrophota bacterium]
MAASGLILVGFLIGHLAGNLIIFGGMDALNAYGAKLRHLGAVLWVVRIGLIVAVVIHIVTSMQLAVENRRARPQGYQMVRHHETTPAARLMVVSGVLVLAYLVYHLLHFTFRVTNPDISHGVDALGRHDIYTMVVHSFQQLPIAFAYVAGMALVCLHLSHGVASGFQTLGLTTERTIPILSWGSRLFALAVFLGYSAIPAAVLLGFVK